MAKIYNRLVAGIEAGATDGFDNLWDAPALTASPDLKRAGAQGIFFLRPFGRIYVVR